MLIMQSALQETGKKEEIIQKLVDILSKNIGRIGHVL